MTGIARDPDLDEIDAKRKKKRRRQRKKKQQRRKRRRQECNNSKPCAAPLNSCQTASCVDHSCQTDTRPNGTSCGTGQVCAGGTCVAACGAGNVCSGQTTCCANACVNTQTSIEHCGACGTACDPAIADDCAGGECRCGNGAACSGGQVCDSGTCVTPCTETGDICEANVECCSGICACGDNPEGGLCQGDFFQGFEQNADGWIGVARVPSGTDGIPAKSGGFYAQVAGPASSTAGFTRWGGYANQFPNGGYDTSIAIYLDPENTAAGTQFDYSSAINQPNCDHRRDFIFTVGRSGGDANFCVSASNNSPGWPCNPDRDPEVLTAAGWYTFVHEFRDDGSGVLEVIMRLLDADETEIASWTLSDPSDIIGTTVGGNRYGWFPNNEFPFVAIDDTSREA